MANPRCHACGRKVSDRNRAKHSTGGMVAGCFACTGAGAPARKARMLTRSLASADGLGHVPTRIARYMPRRYTPAA